jgi:uncharacterized protein
MLFRLTAIAIFLGLQFLIYRSVTRWLRTHYPRLRFLRTVVIAGFVLFNGATITVAFWRPNVALAPSWLMDVAVYPFFIWQGSMLFIGLAFLFRWLIPLPFRGIFALVSFHPKVRTRATSITSSPDFQRFDEGRRTFLRRGAIGLAAASFGTTTYGIYLERGSFECTEREFTLAGLAPGMNGFTIALVTDIHSSVYMTRDDMELVVQEINALHCDVIMVGGDFVNGQVDEVYPFAEAFGRLTAPFGVYGVTGNHDYYTRDVTTVVKEVEQCGIHVLRNEEEILTRNGASFHLFGIDDASDSVTAGSRLDPMLVASQDGIPRILLCHRPYFFPAASTRKIDLMLSGHTHGGQVVLGRFGDVVLTPAALASPYVSGAYRRGNSQMYVSRGVGTVGLPVRINCRPEITRITLKSPSA